MDTGFLNEASSKLGLARSSKPMLIGMAAILVLAAVAVVHVLSGAAAASDFQLEPSEATELASGNSSESVKPVEICVHVSGEVSQPGLYRLESGSRVADAVDAAGGFTEEADDGACNLARVIDDGEHIVIPSTAATASAPDQYDTADSYGNPSNPAIVNINAATAEQLESLPGIGAATARKIIADRDSNGPFGSVEDLTRVSGIGQKKLEALEGLICV